MFILIIDTWKGFVCLHDPYMSLKVYKDIVLGQAWVEVRGFLLHIWAVEWYEKNSAAQFSNKDDLKTALKYYM